MDIIELSELSDKVISLYQNMQITFGSDTDLESTSTLKIAIMAGLKDAFNKGVIKSRTETIDEASYCKKIDKNE